jgi:tetratricopeptide (TPR) repeat protein
MEEAKAHVAKAKVHYDLGEYEQAAEEYIQVYRIKPIPAILFNIAQAWRQAGKYDKARQFYRSYLREVQDPKVQATVKKALREIDELIAKEEKTRNAGPNGVTDPPPGSLTGPAAPPTSARPAEKPPVVVKVEPKPAEPKPAEKPVVVIEAKQVPPPAPAPAEKPAVTVATAKPPPASQPAAEKPAPAQPPQLAAKPAAPPAATNPERPAPKSEASGAGSHVLGYALGGAGLALLGGGALFSVQAARADNELTAGPHTRADADALIDTSKSKHLLGAVLLGAGVLAVAGAAAAFVLSGD